MKGDYTTNSNSLTYTVHISHSQEWSMSNFPCSTTRNIPSHSMENLAFYSLFIWELIILMILTTSLVHFSFKERENVLFGLGSERVKVGRMYSLNVGVKLWTLCAATTDLGSGSASQSTTHTELSLNVLVRACFRCTSVSSLSCSVTHCSKARLT